MENNFPQISVIMSVYNSEKSLSKSINSILNQTYPNIELLIANDGSEDNSGKICEEFASNHNNIKYLHNEKNIGLTKTLNKLLKISSGEYIARQDADDESEKERLEEQYLFLKEKNLDGCSTRARVIGTNKIIPGFSYYIPPKFILKYKNPYIHGTLLIKNTVLQKIDFYDDRFFYAQDYKLMQDLNDNNFKILIMNKSLYRLNMENNISTIYRTKQKYYADCVRKRIIPQKI